MSFVFSGAYARRTGLANAIFATSDQWTAKRNFVPFAEHHNHQRPDNLPILLERGNTTILEVEFQHLGSPDLFDIMLPDVRHEGLGPLSGNRLNGELIDGLGRPSLAAPEPIKRGAIELFQRITDPVEKSKILKHLGMFVVVDHDHVFILNAIEDVDGGFHPSFCRALQTSFGLSGQAESFGAGLLQELQGTADIFDRELLLLEAQLRK